MQKNKKRNRKRLPSQYRPKYQQEKKGEGRWGRFLLWLAGKNPKMLEYCPPNTVAKYKVAGSLILIPAIMALISGNIAAAHMTDNWLTGLAGTLAFALIVLFVDRAIYVFTKPRQFNAAIAMRGALILLLAFALSFPFEIRIFEGAIENQLKAQEKQRIEAARDSFEIKLADIQRAEKAQADKVGRLMTEYFNEMKGLNGRYGDGPVAKRMHNELAAEQKILDQLKGQNADAKAKLEAGLKNDLAVSAGFRVDFSVRVEALASLMDEKKSILVAVWILRLILVLIDLIPLAMKWVSNDEDLELAERKSTQDRDISSRVLKAIFPWKNKVAQLKAELTLERERTMAQFDHMRLQVANQNKHIEFLVNKVINLRLEQAALYDKKFAPDLSQKARKELIDELSQIYESFLADMRLLIERYGRAERQADWNAASAY